MEGKHLIVSVSSISPYVHYIVENDDIILQGSFGQLWSILEERLHFTSEYVIESYNAGVSNFRNKRRDILLRPTVISSDDIDEFDFTFPIGTTWYELYLKDSDEINSSNSYVRNWSVGIWSLTSFLVILFIILLYFTLYISHKFSLKDIYIIPTYEESFNLIQYFSNDKNNFIISENWRNKKVEDQKLKSRNDRSLGNCFIIAFSVFCAQGVNLQFSNTSARILIFFFLLFGMIMFNSYSALLVSQLTLGERFLPFDTLEEIPVTGKRYSLCVRPESYPYLYFTVNNSKNELKRKWKDIINREPCPENVKLDLREMCEPYVAFLETPPIMKEYFTRNINCKMTNLRGRYFMVDFSLLILKGFEEEAKKEINLEIIRYREVGILSHLEDRWISREKTHDINNQKLQVTFEHVKGVLLIYGFCIGFSFVILFIEISIYFCFFHKLSKIKTKFQKLNFINTL